MNFIMILDAILCIVMAGFTGWNWMLAINGKTTIEFWTLSDEYDRVKAPLGFESSKDNLFRVFGTYKILRILSPSTRNVPFTGLEWSFWFKDDGYDANGYEMPTRRSRNADTESGVSATESEQTGAADERAADDDELEMVLI